MFLVGMLSRPPNARINEFLLSLENILEIVSETNVPCYVIGGFYYQTVEPQSSQYSEFCEPFYMRVRFCPAITSATLTDHIRTNDLHNYHASGILNSSLSDHYLPVFSSFSTQSNTSYNHTQVGKDVFPSQLQIARVLPIHYKGRSIFMLKV